LSESRNARDELGRIPKLIERYKDAILTAALRGDLTADWRAKNEGAQPADQLHVELLRQRQSAWARDVGNRAYKAPADPFEISSDLPNLPDSWKYVPVEHLSTKVVDGVHKKPDYKPDGVPFLTVRNLTAGPGIDFSDVRYVSKEDHEEFFRRANPTAGDILITKDGTLGVVRAIRSTKIFSIFVSLALVKPVMRAMSDYLELAFQAPIVQSQMVGVGTGLQHIHLTDLKKDLIPLAPLAEQQVIVKLVRQAFSAIAGMENEATRGAALLDRLDNAILSKAFRGELIPQDARRC
jgi:type I restriction enzyme, S subunit